VICQIPTALNMEAPVSTETVLSVYQTIRCHDPQGNNLEVVMLDRLKTVKAIFRNRPTSVREIFSIRDMRCLLLVICIKFKM
jgi:hypothetical protein